MDFDDLVTELAAPAGRTGKVDGLHEHHVYEGAIMVAYAMHLLRTEPVMDVCIHPDGEHGKQFDFSAWLGRQGFTLSMSAGKTSYGGTYTHKDGRTISVILKPGRGDVIANVGTKTIRAECKGGIINTRHSGQVSRLYKGLCETVGLLLAAQPGGRQVAVVPYTEQTFRLATRLALRCALAGIELALVKRRGEVIDVRPSEADLVVIRRVIADSPALTRAGTAA